MNFVTTFFLVVFCLLAQAQDCASKTNEETDTRCAQYAERNRCGDRRPASLCAKTCCYANGRSEEPPAESPTTPPLSPSATSQYCSAPSNWQTVITQCPDCTALVRTNREKSCAQYCQEQKLVCRAVWEEVANNCEKAESRSCGMVYTDTTDLMCQCVYPDQSQPNPPAASPPASSPPSSGSTKSNSKFEGAVIVPDQEGERLLILDPTQAWTNNPPILWEYKATGAVARLFNSKWSDAKVEHINGKDYILFCGSGSKAVAMVSVDTKQVVFAKTVGQSPHSIAMLPDGNILVVDTGGGSKEGRLFVFDSRTGRELDNVATNKYTHGAVWVTPKNRLYSAPGGQIWKYSNGKLTLERSGAWDSECNHDVMPGMTQDEIICTGGSSSKNNKGVHSFNTKTGKAAPVVAPVGGAKGADIRRSDGQVIYVLQSRDSRDDTVRFKDATDRGNKDFLFYKAHFYQRNIMLPELTVSGFPGSASSTKFITEEAEAGEQLELSGSDRRAWAGSFWFLFAPLLVYIH